MPKVIVDSDLLSEFLKEINPTVVANANSYQQAYTAYTFTSLTALEVLSGFEHRQATARIKRAEALFSRNEEIVPNTDDHER